jgi:uncharacterized membrane protein YhiD involved in acid resistance
MKDPIQLSDILKSNFLDFYESSTIDFIDISTALLFVLIIWLLISYVYKKTFSGVLYSKSFSLSLIGLSSVTCMIIMTITSNIILSLGMVGALSIVRFRSAIKDPNDIVFMFWSIAVGIACGAGFFTIAGYGSIIISIILLLVSKYRILQAPYLLVIQSNNDCLDQIEQILGTDSLSYSMKSVTASNDTCESIFEIRTEKKTIIIQKIKAIDCVRSVSIISYQGEYSD